MLNVVLIISANPADVRALDSALGSAYDGPFAVRHSGTLEAGLAELAAGGIDAVLVDLTLPDGHGLPAFERLRAACPHTPIMTLCDLDDERDAKEAVQRGAQGWLSKGYFDKYLVPQSLRNIIERMKVEHGLFLAHARARATLNSIGDAVVSVGLDGRVDYLNAAAEQITGWSHDLACGQPVAAVLRIVDEHTGGPMLNPLMLVLRSGQPVDTTSPVTLLRPDGRRVPIEDSAAPIHDWERRLVGAVMVFRDVSANHELTAELRHRVHHDVLTSLPNRLLLNDRITQAIALAGRSDALPALLFLDLDKFKHVNDSLGHGVGDRLLQAVSERLVACVRSADTVSRHGGDEFVLLLSGERAARDVAATADKILHALALPFIIDGHTLHTSTSIGISIYPQDGTDAATLLKNADTAMYHAKERGRNNFQFFLDDMNTHALERQAVGNALRRALEHQEFELHYQAKIDLDSDRITGVEALLRWNHPAWGLMTPDQFIPIAEENGLIVPIGRWVLHEACSQAVRWQASGCGPVSVAVNVSALEFRQRDFFDAILRIFASTGVDPACLQFELTETVLMRDVVATAALLAQLKLTGVHIAVDDFGTGYSSLSYLNRFPIDILKIDQSFVHAIDASAAGNGVIVRAVIDMGKNLHQRVVAEGVENELQLEFLKAHGCNEAQGFLFSQPVNATRMRELLLDGFG